jgi:nitroreductase
MAYSNMVFQAISMGLSVHPMGGYNREAITHLLEIPERFKPVVVAAVGYKSDELNFPDHLIDREKQKRPRKSITEIAFEGKFRKKG